MCELRDVIHNLPSLFDVPPFLKMVVFRMDN
jgi:hypothetical protein